MINNQPLLSVIVPCYNVEKYIDKCIFSIVNQTYTNLEIILINDGSTDNSGMICDAWEERDQRIHVIHKENEGVSYARKTAVESATAEYITFVDPDDWIDENMYTNMMNALLSTNSDIAQCGVCDAYEDGSIKHRYKEYKDGSFEIVDRINGVLLILEDKEWISSMWNKIFKKHLFDTIEFPKGRVVCEDVSIAHILFHYALQTVYLRDEYYFYFRRSDSALRFKGSDMVTKIKKINDAYIAYYERYCFAQQHAEYHYMLNNVKNHVFPRGLRLLRFSIIYPQYFPKDYSHSLEKQIQMIQFNKKNMLKEYYTTKMRLEIFIFLISPVFYKILIRLISK